MLISSKGGQLRSGGDLDAYAGMAAHECLAQRLAFGHRPGLEEISRDVYTILATQVTRAGQLRATRLMATSFVAAYFTWFWDPGWEFLRPKAPRRREGPRPDVAWRLPSGGVLFDEIKTGSAAPGLVEYDDQVREYVEFGNQQYGDGFVGVRLCTVRAPRLAVMCRPDGHKEAAF